MNIGTLILKLFVVSVFASSILCLIWIKLFNAKNNRLFKFIFRDLIENENEISKHEYVFATWFGLFFTLFILGIYIFAPDCKVD